MEMNDNIIPMKWMQYNGSIIFHHILSYYIYICIIWYYIYDIIYIYDITYIYIHYIINMLLLLLYIYISYVIPIHHIRWMIWSPINGEFPVAMFVELGLEWRSPKPFVQKLYRYWPWLPVITGYFNGIMHSINGVLLVL